MVDLSRIIITGCEGMIGKQLDFGMKLNKSEFDVNNPLMISQKCDSLKPLGILSLSNVGIRDIQTDPLRGYNVNVLGIYNLINECKKRDIPLITISSGAVFNGDFDEVFSEDSIPMPLNLYGQSKYISEILIRESNCKHLIIRTGWLFGFRNTEKKSMPDKMIESAINGLLIKATDDQKGSLTYVNDFKRELARVIESDLRGTHHIVNGPPCTAYEFITYAAKLVESKSSISAVKMSDFSANLTRSKSEALSSKHIQLREWKEAVEEYIKESRN